MKHDRYFGFDAWNIQAGTLGSEQQPYVIIDNFFVDPEMLVRSARQANFSIRAPHYPGIRAAVPHPYLEMMVPPVREVLVDYFGYTNEAAVQECFYSQVTQPQDTLSPLQCLPHFDGVGDSKVALLHFLCGAEDGGTHFFRHRSTSYETVTTERFSMYKSTLEADVRRVGLPKREYVKESTPLFELIATLPAAWNRAILYRGVNLHAIGLGVGHNFGAPPGAGRLTINTFLAPST